MKQSAKKQSKKIGQDYSTSLIIYISALLILLTIHYFLPTAYATEISAKAAIVMDTSSEKILYAKNPHLRLPPASTTKLVTAMVVLDKISPETVVTISENAANTHSVTPHLKEGEKYTVKDLLYFALMRSVNGATVALAEAVAGSEKGFVEIMNDKVAYLGLKNTRFINSSGLPGPDQYITVFDLAKIMKEALRYPLIRDILNTKEKEVYTLDGREIFVKNTNNLLWTNEDILGGKTGYTRAAGHCFVCAANKGSSTLIAAILGETERDSLWKNSQLLLSIGHDVLTQKAVPMIYFSGVEEKPILFASYKSKSNKKFNVKKQKKSKKTYISKNKKNKTTKIAKKPDINKQQKIAKKKTKKLRKNTLA